MTDAKTLTLHEPWASAVALGLKRHETRSWGTRYRGWLVIHAGRRWERDQAESEAVRLVRDAFPGWEPALGKVVAVAWLDDCSPTAPILKTFGSSPPPPPAEPHDATDRLLGGWSPGRWAWRLTRVRAVPDPFPFVGRQSLKMAPRELLDELRRQLGGEFP